jgi:hypothetical protein
VLLANVKHKINPFRKAEAHRIMAYCLNPRCPDERVNKQKLNGSAQKNHVQILDASKCVCSEILIETWTLNFTIFVHEIINKKYSTMYFHREAV